MRKEVSNNNEWLTVFIDMSKEGLKKSFRYNREYILAKDQYTATDYDNYLALSYAIRDRLVERWIMTQQRYHQQNLKRVYYLSMEFLIGRLMGNNVLNLGLMEETTKALEELGFDIDEIRDQEKDAGLGNGGLGRLAACFLDSMATMRIPAHGYGIRYDYGIFNQKIINGAQVEYPDGWLKLANPWEIARPEYAVTVRFYGKTYIHTDKSGKLFVNWVDTDHVLAMPYDVPVPGYKNDVVNTLRLWSARSAEDFDFTYFNHGDYQKAVQNKLFSENISKVLYPNDSVSQGVELRLKQEYFFTAASIADIIRRFKVENSDFRKLPEHAAIQLNDTHPALAIVELLRILIDEEGLEWNTAWEITVKTFAYTNHTIMPEALESWAIPLFGTVLPRHLELIYEINFRFMREVAGRFPGDNNRLRRMSIIEESNPKRIRMAYLAIAGSHSVNGVSALHSEILKAELFRDFYQMWPDKFNNKTNGITQRRWLKKSNTRLSDLISESIGDKWTTDLYELQKLMPFKEKEQFRTRWQDVKEDNKLAFIDYIGRTTGIAVNPRSMFDVQVKRIHEYKRQVLFMFYIISQYLKLKNNPRADICPRTFFLGGKAAPGYYMAKLIIRFINSVGEVINNDKVISDKLKVVFLENYRVSLAEKIFPASDLSEQISTAGTEASGTGCMKFMINGALTIGTLDGANIEMLEETGRDNMFIFGLDVKGIENLRRKGYSSREYINNSPVLKEIFQLIRSNFFSPIETGIFEPIVSSLYNADNYLICADFESYCQEQDKVSALYENKAEWTRKSIINVARSGKFSSDRTIEEYARDIWEIPGLGR